MKKEECEKLDNASLVNGMLKKLNKCIIAKDEEEYNFIVNYFDREKIIDFLSK